MPPITGSRSLFPRSSTPSSNRSPCGFPARVPKHTGGQWGLPRSLTCRHRFRSVYPFRVYLCWNCAMTTCAQAPRAHPTACLLAMAYQQIWPFNPYPASISSSLALPMRNSPGPSTAVLLAVSNTSPRGLMPPLARGYFVRWASHQAVASLACHRRRLVVVHGVTAPLGFPRERDKANQSLRSET